MNSKYMRRSEWIQRREIGNYENWKSPLGAERAKRDKPLAISFVAANEDEHRSFIFPAESTHPRYRSNLSILRPDDRNGANNCDRRPVTHVGFKNVSMYPAKLSVDRTGQEPLGAGKHAPRKSPWGLTRVRVVQRPRR